VTVLKTGKQVIVRINDRGPFASGRVIDVSRPAAEMLGMVGAGVARVKVEIVQ
jgi:rare lipoprotein A